MKKALWLLGASLLAALACGAAGAEEGAFGFDVSPLETPRVLPSPNSKQSPAASACATGGGRIAPEARIAACSSLIESGKWHGRGIGWAYANRCAVYSAQGQTDKALADCVQAILLDPDIAISYQIRGDIMLKRGESEKALGDYDSAIGHGARDAAIFVDRGNLLLAKGETEKAVADFDQALQFSPGSTRALVARGGARLTSGDFDAAIVDLDKAIEISPSAVLAWFNRGSAWYAKGERMKAAENFRQALTLDPANAYAALWLFISSDGADAKSLLQANSGKLSQKAWPWPVVQLYLGDRDAQQTLAAAASQGEQCEAQFYVGQERLLKKATDEALPYLRKAAEICPKDFGEYAQAKNELKTLAAAAPKPAEPASIQDADKKDKQADPAPELKK